MNSLYVVIAGAALVLAIASFSLSLVRSRLKSLRLRRLPFGWKYLEAQGPLLGMRLSSAVTERLGIPDSGQHLLIYTFDCSRCTFLSGALPALLADVPALTATVLSGRLSGSPLGSRKRLLQIIDAALIKELAFSIAPYIVLFENGIPIRKGLVNSLEQLRLTVDPSQVHLDMQLR